MCNSAATYSYSSTICFFVFILFCIICWFVIYNSADYGGGASACKLVAPFFGLWDLRRCLSKHQRCTTRECGWFDAWTAQTAYLFVISQFFFVRLPRLHKETVGETAGTTILYFHFGACLNASFGWSCVAWAWHDRKGMKRASRSGWSPEVVCQHAPPHGQRVWSMSSNSIDIVI